MRGVEKAKYAKTQRVLRRFSEKDFYEARLSPRLRNCLKIKNTVFSTNCGDSGVKKLGNL